MAMNDGWEDHGVYEPFIECNCCEEPLNDIYSYYELKEDYHTIHQDWHLCQKCYDGFKKLERIKK